MPGRVVWAKPGRLHHRKTGHSYIKRRTHELGALAECEKSGQFFFNAPMGRGYDDGLISATTCRNARFAPKSMPDFER
jgi:phosphomannomutase/phosphoglucomutase